MEDFYAREVLDSAVYERIMKSADHKEGDRVPIWDLIDNRAVYQYFAPNEKDPLQASVKVYEGLGIDLCRGIAIPPSEEEEGNVSMAGEFGYAVEGQTVWLAERPYKKLEDIKDYHCHIPSKEEVMDGWVPEMKRWISAFAPRVMFVPGCGVGLDAARHTIGFELFSYAIYDAPEEVNRILNEHMEASRRYSEAMAESRLCPLAFVWDDIAFKSGTMYSPRWLRKNWLPRLKYIIEPLKRAGIKVIFHSDGNLLEIVDDLISAGVDGLNPLEQLAGMDLELLKRKWGDKLILVGGIDCSQLLPLGTPEEIREKVKWAIKVAAPGGGFFIGSSSEIVPSTPLENVLTFYQAIHEFGKYPINL
ncbi:MAG: uroporphyrinogen decarboxylase family protein [bacterium]